MRWTNQTKLDMTYSPPELRRNGRNGPTPQEAPQPVLDGVERRLGALVVTATAVISSCGLFDPPRDRPVPRIPIKRLDDDLEPQDAALRSLLHAQLSLHQTQRVETCKKIMSAALVAGHATPHLVRAAEVALTREERNWIITCLRPVTNCVSDLGMSVAAALNQGDPALAKEAIPHMRQIDTSVAQGLVRLDSIESELTRRVFCAALTAVEVMRDAFGTIAAVLVFEAPPSLLRR